MKKITLLLFLGMAFSFTSYAQYLQDFTDPPTGWISYKGTVTSEQSRWEYYAEGGYMVVTSGDAASEDWLVTPTAPITATNSKLVFDQTDILAANNNSTLTIRIAEYVDETTQTTHEDFTIVDTQTELEVSNGAEAVFSSHSVDLSAYEGKTVHIAFVWAQTQAVGDALAIDNVNLIDKNLLAPGAVTTPTPAQNALNVDLDEANNDIAIFSWTPSITGGAATAYEVYIGVSGENLSYLGDTTETSAAIILNYSTTYNWAIVAKNGAGNSLENALIWTFTTEDDPSLSAIDHELKTISVFPNPVKDIVNIINTTTSIDNIVIANELGQQVLRLESHQIFNKSINLSALSKGLYFMTIKSDDKFNTIKIIKE